MRNRSNRYTVFDVMEARGVFDENPANISSPRYAGPVEYPRMFYHPHGRTRVIQKAEILNTPMGPQKVGEQFELISRVAHNEEEANRLMQAGWHDHPAKAIAASGADAPPMTAHGRIADLERQVQLLMNQLNAAKAAPPPPPEDDDIDVPPLEPKPVPAPPVATTKAA